MGYFENQMERAKEYYRIVNRRWGPDEYDRRLENRRNVAESEKQAAEAAYPRDLKWVRVTVNDDCPAPEWWAAARAAKDCPSRWWQVHFEKSASVVVDTAAAAEFLAWAETLPGWSNGPEACHPLLAEDESKRVRSPMEAAYDKAVRAILKEQGIDGMVRYDRERVEIVVNAEVNAEAWWAEAHERAEKCRNAGFTAFLRDHLATGFTCERAEAVRLLVWCASLPEWEGGEPLVLCESEESEGAVRSREKEEKDDAK